MIAEMEDGVADIVIGTHRLLGKDVKWRDLALLIRDVVGFQGDIRFDPSKPDGTPQKLLDVSRLTALGWKSRTSLREGIEKTYRWYREHAGQDGVFRRSGRDE